MFRSLFSAVLVVLLVIGTPSSLVSAQDGQCAEITKFNRCMNQASKKTSACNDLVKDTPTLEFYDCLCTTQAESLSCYSLCADSAPIQDQYRAQAAASSSTCQAAQELRDSGYGASSTVPSVFKSRTLFRPTKSSTTTSETEFETLRPFVVSEAGLSRTSGLGTVAQYWALSMLISSILAAYGYNLMSAAHGRSRRV